MTLGRFPRATLTMDIHYLHGLEVGILRIEISDAIIVKRCRDTETSLKTARKPIETLHKLRTITIT